MTQKLPQSALEIKVEVPFEEFKPHVERAAGLLSEETEIKGFRKGKAPIERVKEAVGEQAIYEKAADIAVRKTHHKVMEEMLAKNEISAQRPPIGKPEVTVTKLAPGNELNYTVKLALLPEVELPDYKKIAERVKKERKEVSVSDEEVEKTIDWVRQSRAPLITVDRPAATGDNVEIDFEIRQGGVKIEKGESKSHPLTIGQNKFIPGFEDELVGMKAGEEKSFTLKIPDKWHEQSMAGKALDFKTTMKTVQEKKLPEVNDEFAKGLGNFSSVDALKSNVREGLTKEKKDKESQRIKAMIIEEVAKDAKTEVPDVLIDAELDKMLNEMRGSVEQMGMKWEDYMVHIKKSPEELKKEWRAEAEKRVRIALCLREIAKKENIQVGEEEVKERADQFLRQFQSVGEAGKKMDPGALQEYARGILRNEKVFELLERS